MSTYQLSVRELNIQVKKQLKIELRINLNANTRQTNVVEQVGNKNEENLFEDTYMLTCFISLCSHSELASLYQLCRIFYNIVNEILGNSCIGRF